MAGAIHNSTQQGDPFIINRSGIAHFTHPKIYVTLKKKKILDRFLIINGVTQHRGSLLVVHCTQQVPQSIVMARIPWSELKTC